MVRHCCPNSDFRCQLACYGPNQTSKCPKRNLKKNQNDCWVEMIEGETRVFSRCFHMASPLYIVPFLCRTFCCCCYKMLASAQYFLPQAKYTEIPLNMYPSTKLTQYPSKILHILMQTVFTCLLHNLELG